MFAFVQSSNSSNCKNIQCDTDGFTIIKKKSRKPVKLVPPKALNIDSRFNVDKLMADLSLQERVAGFNNVLDLILANLDNQRFKYWELIVFGLGRCSQSLDAFKQLEFCELLRRRLGNERLKSTFVYDPVMTDADYQMTDALGFTRIKDNDRGYRSISADGETGTIVFMPRCPLGLYDNLLEENFSTEQLKSLVIIGNNFNNYRLRYSDQMLQEKAPHVLAVTTLQGLLNALDLSKRLPEDFDRSLNDLALHLFDPSVCCLPVITSKQQDPELI